MPRINEFYTVRAQVESFIELGFNVSLEMQGIDQRFAPKIRLSTDTKEYRFSDPDWNVVSLQLAKLYGVLKNEKRDQHVRSDRNATNGNPSVRAKF